MRKTKPSHVRFWAKVDKRGPVMPGMVTRCWVWIGARAKSGYGNFKATRYVGAHVFGYEVAHGHVPDGLQVNHKCNNRLCVRGDHVYAGTPAENGRDTILSGHSTAGERHKLVKLTRAQVDAIRCSTERGVQLASEYGVSTATICLIRKGRIWRDAHTRLMLAKVNRTTNG